MKRRIALPLLSAALILAATGCMSVPKPSDIPDGMSVIEMSQKGQEAIDDDNYKAAEVWYREIIARYGATDPKALTSAEYEIAHMRVKQKKYDEAKNRLEEIIARYGETGGAKLPPEYLILAKNDLTRVEAALEKSGPSAKKGATDSSSPDASTDQPSAQ